MSSAIAPIRRIGTRTYAAWREDRTLRLGAGLAYYALFAVLPLIALTGALAEQLFGTADVQEYIAGMLNEFGVADSDSVSDAVADALSRDSTQTRLGLIGFATLLFAASVFFLALADAVNVIWNVPVGSGLWNTIRRRLVAFLMVLATGGVLLAGIAVTAVSGLAQKLLPVQIELLDTLTTSLAGVASWVALALALAMLFRFLPPVRVAWRVALLAGTATAVLLVLGTVVIGWYLREFGGSSVAGAFGALLAALTWVYYEAQILLGGMQLVKVLSNADR
jgi:membrane protein